MDASPDDRKPPVWHNLAARKWRQGVTPVTERCRVELVLALKFVALYGLEVFVIAVVGAAAVAGLYQLVRNQARAAFGGSEADRSRGVTLTREGWRAPAAVGTLRSPAGRPREDGWSPR